MREIGGLASAISPCYSRVTQEKPVDADSRTLLEEPQALIYIISVFNYFPLRKSNVGA